MAKQPRLSDLLRQTEKAAAQKAVTEVAGVQPVPEGQISPPVPTLADLQQQLQQLTQNVNGKADASALTGKANASTVQQLSQNLNTLSSNLDAKLDKTNGMAMGLSLQAESNQDTSAVRMSQLKGGLRRPYFVLKNVGAAAVVASDVIKNPFPEALTYQPTQVDAYVMSRPLLATTITIGYTLPPATTVIPIYTRVVALLDIPLVDGLLDVITPKTKLPEVPVGARLQASCSAGTFKIIIDGLLQ